MKIIIAEKPSVGMTIANVVGATKKQDGYIEGNGYIVSWCYGHLIGLEEPTYYIVCGTIDAKLIIITQVEQLLP